MSQKTKIQWCDSTTNPVMGCDGCPLFPSADQGRGEIQKVISHQGISREAASEIVRRRCADLDLTGLFKNRRAISLALTSDLREVVGKLSSGLRPAIEKAISSSLRCYAAVLHSRWSPDPAKAGKRGNPGFAPRFEQVTPFPGRTGIAAAFKSLAGIRRPDAPWLDALPRLIFVSDMGDALSRGISFEFLKKEIVDVAISPNGRRHIWLWLTKRPRRMAAFASWLTAQGVKWPDNLVPMTSVIDRKMVAQLKYLRQIPAKIRGISVEPLWEQVDLDLEGIDWVIAGGESGPYAKDFDLAWARVLQDACRRNDKAFFMKQLGRRPLENAERLTLQDQHGGDWAEWPEDLRVREFPPLFFELVDEPLMARQR